MWVTANILKFTAAILIPFIINTNLIFSDREPESSSNTGAINTIAREQLLNQRAKIIGVLPGLGAYDNDTSDSETSSSDSECDFSVQKKIKIQVNTQ